jgi:HPt (histidine-containing phosphotransfer) domain-containing protein
MRPAEQPCATIEQRADAVARTIVDVSDGIERVMGNRALYGRMLGRFRSDHAGGAGPIRTALAGGERALAHRLVHTLKGASGMIGALPLHRQACSLEQALLTEAGSHAGSHESELDALARALGEVVRVIDMLLACDPPARSPAAAPIRPLADDPALLAQLLTLLMNADGAAVDLLHESSASLKAILGETRFDGVAAAAQEFDFDAALAALASPGGARVEHPRDNADSCQERLTKP